MKIYLACIICLAAALLCSCAGEWRSKAPDKSDIVVLEIMTHASGMVYPKEGDLLDFRLHESGRFEYDSYPDFDRPRVKSSNVVITRREAQLNDTEVKELISLTQSPEFLNAQAEYLATRPMLDALFVTTLLFVYGEQEKRIMITDYDDDLSARNLSRYPASLVRLLGRVKELKAQTIGERATTAYEKGAVEQQIGADPRSRCLLYSAA